ncbi:MAG: hypothetical protein H6739_12875 [Alphaproteobacteria bacterium]|nr:hypothetical protein [Alphaproteobacteria bacterium]
MPALPPRPDVPAAHSMDTEWFAVDQDGHVARFDTGEDGALPVYAATGFGPADPNFDAALLNAAMAAHHYAASPEALAPHLEEARRPGARERPLLIVEDVQDVMDRVVDGTLLILRREAPAALLPRERLSEALAAELGARPTVRCAIAEEEVYDLIHEEPGPSMGLYRFGRDHGDEPGHYTLDDAPDTPLRLDTLHPALTAPLEAVRLGLRFPEVDEVHLADHMSDADAATWGDWGLRGERMGQPRPGAGPGAANKGALILGLLVLGVLALLLLLS